MHIKLDAIHLPQGGPVRVYITVPDILVVRKLVQHLPEEVITTRRVAWSLDNGMKGTDLAAAVGMGRFSTQQKQQNIGYTLSDTDLRFLTT